MKCVVYLFSFKINIAFYQYDVHLMNHSVWLGFCVCSKLLQLSPFKRPCPLVTFNILQAAAEMAFQLISCVPRYNGKLGNRYQVALTPLTGGLCGDFLLYSCIRYDETPPVTSLSKVSSFMYNMWVSSARRRLYVSLRNKKQRKKWL